jgi:16S rRNA (guanine(966)-N(2))-methyltransferase RsmD
LDLFSGTGSLGIESLSRGSRVVYFLDESRESINLIKHNTRFIEDSGNKYRIIRSDVLKYLKSCSGPKWDIIFLDPPYKIESGIMKQIFDNLANKKITGSDSLIIYEYFFKKDATKEIENLKKIKESHFGDKKVIYLSPY